MKPKIINILTVLPLVVAQAAYADSSGVHVVNWYHEILENFLFFLIQICQ